MSLAIRVMKTSVGELQRDYLFKMFVEDCPASIKGIFPAEESMDLFLVKGIFPERKTASIQVKWSGEFVYYSGPDESTKTGELTFRLDQDMRIKDFWEAAKDLTGNVSRHSAVKKPMQALTLGIYMVDVGKNTITDYRQLEDVLVYSISNINPDKEGGGVVTFTVGISWDNTGRDDNKRGKPISS